MLLKATNLAKTYCAFVVLSSLNCRFQSGEWIGLAVSNFAVTRRIEKWS